MTTKLEAIAAELGDGGDVILKAHDLTVAGRDGQSSQPLDDTSFGTPNDAIEPPESLDGLARLTQENGIRRAIHQAIALNTVGLGYQLAPADGHERDIEDPTAAGREIRAELEALARRDVRLKRPSFTELLKAVKEDEESCGNGYIEVSRNKSTGRINGLYLCPGPRVRRLRDFSGYLLLPPTGDESRAQRFYNFGEKVQYDRTGKPLNKVQSGKRWATNELIAFNIYTTECRDYGLPRDSGLIFEYLADKLANEANVGFFDNSGTPPTILFVQGDEKKSGGRVTYRVPEQTVQRITDTLKGKSKGSRVAIIPVPPGTSTKAEQLGGVSERDIGYTEFRDKFIEHQLAAHRMQPIFIGSSGDGRYDAEVQRAITLEQVFDPEQHRYEDRLRYTILADLGFAEWELTFKRLAVEGDAARRESTERAAEVGLVTRRQFMAAHGLPPMPEAKENEEPKPGMVPFGWNDELVEPTGPPAGAQNRVNDAADQRGLKPGIGGRTNRDKRDGQPRHVEDAVGQLNGRVGASQRRAVERAVSRARGL